MPGGREELDLRSLLAAVEQTSPIDAVDVLSDELARTVQARHVALLVANFSGSALVRVSHVENTGHARDGHNERAVPVPLPGTLHEEVVFTQTTRVLERSDDWLALVPVTERGDAIGVLEVSFADEPSAEILDYVVAGAHALAYVLIASDAIPTCSSGLSVTSPSRWLLRSSGACSPPPTAWRPAR